MNILEHYKPMISPKEKNFEELHHWLEVKVDIEEIPLSAFTTAFIKHLDFNAENAITNAAQLKAADFIFTAYKLLPTKKNETYNAKLNGKKEKFIYVILEEKTGYILTNNAKLHLELTIEKGISQNDYDHDTARLMEYISCIEHLEKKEY